MARLHRLWMVVVVLSMLLPLVGVSTQTALASGSRCPAEHHEQAYDANDHSPINISAHIDIYACALIINGTPDNSTLQYIISIWGDSLAERVFGWRLWRCGSFYGSGNAQLISGSQIRYEERYTDKQDVRTIVRPRKDWDTPLLAMTTGDIAIPNGSNCPPGADTVGSSVTQGVTYLYSSTPGGVFYANVVHQG